MVQLLHTPVVAGVYVHLFLDKSYVVPSAHGNISVGGVNLQTLFVESHVPTSHTPSLAGVYVHLSEDKSYNVPVGHGNRCVPGVY